jgi:sulfur-oxidizing protein SoxY
VEKQMTAMNTEIKLNRRQILGGLTASALLVGVSLLPIQASRAADDVVSARIKELVGDGPIRDGRITLDVPEIAENGNTVPVAFEVDSPMTAEDYVKAVHVLAVGNPAPEVASFGFTPMNGVAAASTRIRLARTQNVVVLAEMSDGSVYRAQSEVKVTIGGCGG